MEGKVLVLLFWSLYVIIGVWGLSVVLSDGFHWIYPVLMLVYGIVIALITRMIWRL